MGLDMNLYREYYIGNKWKDKKDQLRITGGQHDIEQEKIVYVTEDVADWRKFNALHGWMVDNVQDGNDDCRTYYVDEAKLKELYEIVKKIQKNHNLAAKLLPNREGFFFGDQEYDEYYFENIDYTVKVLEDIIKNPDGSIKYGSSW